MRWFVVVTATLLSVWAAANPSRIVDAAIVRPLAEAIFRVEARNENGSVSMGSAVLVADTIAASNCHVTRRATSISLYRSGLEWRVVSQHADTARDLCLLKLARSGGVTAPQLVESRPRIGSTVVSVGFSGGGGPFANQGRLQALHAFDGGEVVQSTTPFTSGASGGGLFDERGALVGIVTFRSRGREPFHYSLPIAWVREALTASRFEPVKPLALTPTFWERPVDVQPAFLSVPAALMQRNWRTAQDKAAEWCQTEPANPVAWASRGLAFMETNNAGDAAPAFKRATALDGGNARYWYELCRALVQSGDKGEARTAFQTLRQLDADLAQDFRVTVLSCAADAKGDELEC